MAELRTSGSLGAVKTTGAELEAAQMVLLVGDRMNKERIRPIGVC